MPSNYCGGAPPWRPALVFSALGLALSCIAACGGNGEKADAGDPCAGFPATPTASVASAAGLLQIGLMSLPNQPPTRGVNSFKYVVTNKAGQAQTGLSLAVTPWMPAMNHGASVQPTMVDCGSGTYVATNVVFAMAGSWELQTAFSGAAVDSATPTFEIQ